MARKIRQAPAPSIRAASMVSAGIDWSAPVHTRNMYGKPSQRLTPRIDSLASHGFCEPRDLGAAQQHLVDEAEPRVEHASPDEGGQEPRDRVREDQQRPVDLAAADARVVEHDREEEPERERREHREEREGERPDARSGRTARPAGSRRRWPVKLSKPTPTRQPGVSTLPSSDTKLPESDGRVRLAGRGVGERVARRVVLERRLVDVPGRAVLRADRALRRVVGEGDPQRGDRRPAAGRSRRTRARPSPGPPSTGRPRRWRRRPARTARRPCRPGPRRPARRRTRGHRPARRRSAAGSASPRRGVSFWTAICSIASALVELCPSP